MQRLERTVMLPNQQSVRVYEWQPEVVKAVIVLVHGLGEHAGRYEHVAAALTQAGYLLTAFDLPGHGKSDGVRGHIASYDLVMDFVNRLLEEATAKYPNKPRFVYGHSMGGNIMLYYLLKRRPNLAGAVVTSPGLGTADPVPAWKSMLGKALYNMAPSMQMDNGLLLSGLARDASVVEAYKADPLVHGKISTRLGIDLLNHGQEIVRHAGEFPDIPLLLMQGSGDKIVSPQVTDQFAKNFRGDLTYRVWDGMYHELHNEPEKQQVLDAMVTWLDQRVAAY